MSAWLSEDLAAPPTAPAHRGAQAALRAFDVLLAALLLVPLLPALALLRRRWAGDWHRGVHAAFLKRRLDVPAGRLGAALRRLGAPHWPVLLHIVRGEMAWVGPRPRRLDEAPSPAAQVRPGVVNPWWLRQRTAVHFGTEAQADRDYLARRGLRHDLGLLLRSVPLALLPAADHRAAARVRVGGVDVDNLTMSEALERIAAMLDGAAPQQVCFVNPACVNIAAGHRAYRRVLAQAALVLPDGIGLRLASVLLRTPLRQNVNGTDLFPRLCEALQRRGASVYLLGGRPGVAEAVAAEVGRRWPRLRVAGLRHGYFAPAEEAAVAAEVRASGADVLLVARGVPSQDLFVARHLPLLGVRVAMGVGGLFDFVSGRIPRAPQWMREAGLEWVWRLRQEPTRMWRRYLVGNVTFLARVAWQRAAGRRSLRGANQPATSPSTVADVTPRAERRAVVFATVAAGPDLPVPPGIPAALLTLGHQSVAEHLMDRLAQAGVADVDLVACEQPEALRALLGDGSRWGLRLRWQLVKHPSRPYAALATAARATASTLVVLHADRVPSAATLGRLLAGDGLGFDASGQGGLRWSGCASAAPDRLAGLDPHLDREALAAHLQASGLQAWIADEPVLTGAAGLMAAQQQALHADALAAVPASWIRREWGAMSPSARVDDGAVVTGPALIGPGSWVQRGAVIGAGVVLGADTVVSGGTLVRDALVLPGTYLGPGLEVAHAIVDGSRLQHVALGVRLQLAPGDGLALSLAAPTPVQPGWAARAAAALVVGLAAPALAGHRLARRARARPPAWGRRDVVTGRDPSTRAPVTTRLITPRRGGSRADARWAALAALGDVAAGRRCWLGVRPRSVGEWYALSPVWQDILAGRPVGVLYAPVAQGDADEAAELAAAADVHGCSISRGRRVAEWVRARAVP
jgi:N-acetylglucosaminyldiphosphoundecaprenol N-acetyl-beta-D-mannosaminyltransferase